MDVPAPPAADAVPPPPAADGPDAVPHKIIPEDAEECQSYLFAAKAHHWTKDRMPGLYTAWHENERFKHLRLDQLKYQYRKYLSETRKRLFTGTKVEEWFRTLLTEGFATACIMKVLTRLWWVGRRAGEFPVSASDPFRGDREAEDVGGGPGAGGGAAAGAGDGDANANANANANDGEKARDEDAYEFFPLWPTELADFLSRVKTAYNHPDGTARHGGKRTNKDRR